MALTLTYVENICLSTPRHYPSKDTSCRNIRFIQATEILTILFSWADTPQVSISNRTWAGERANRSVLLSCDRCTFFLQSKINTLKGKRTTFHCSTNASKMNKPEQGRYGNTDKCHYRWEISRKNVRGSTDAQCTRFHSVICWNIFAASASMKRWKVVHRQCRRN